MNPVSYADGLMAEFKMATKKADKDAITAELVRTSEEVKTFDTSGLDDAARHYVSDVVTRLAAAIDAK